MRSERNLIISAIVFLLLCLLCPLSLAETDAPVKVIVDCDMGYMNDDALALSMLLKAQERGLVEIIGITLEGGNVFIDAPYENYGETQYGSAKYTRDFLAALNETSIPCIRGTDFPDGFGRENLRQLDEFYKKLHYIKDNDGYGAIHFFTAVHPELFCDSNEAADFLIEAVRKYPDEVVIFAIGPTMNIARAVRMDVGFASRVKSIYYMGGAFGEVCMMEDLFDTPVEGIQGANVTPVTEYNVLYDPVSFEACITAQFPVQYILPGSCNVGIDQSVADQMILYCRCEGISALWAKYYKTNIQDYPYWDPLTVYAFLCPDAIEKSFRGYVAVNTDRSSDNFGRTGCYSADEYELLPPEEQARCGAATVIYETSGFWDFTIGLLCD